MISLKTCYWYNKQRSVYLVKQGNPVNYQVDIACGKDDKDALKEALKVLNQLVKDCKEMLKECE